MYLHREIEETIKAVEQTFPAIVITGPRQSGKSTLLRNFLKNRGSYISLDDPSFRELLSDNPTDYLASRKKPVVIDEIQYMPELASYLKILVDEDRRPGSWFITGSQQFSVMKHVSESLAGRAAILALPTLSGHERRHSLPIERYLLSSSYPEPATIPSIDTGIWYSSYLQTYLERDVRAIMDISNLRDFEQFIRFLAGRTGTVLNYSSLASDLGISVPTVKRWISVLEASYIIFLLPPFYQNFGKRIIKAPKLYFYDIGLVNYLINLTDSNLLMNGPMAGALFETAVLSDIIKRQHAGGRKPEMYYWRSQSGIEVDLIVPKDGRLVPYEVKLSSTIKPMFYKHMSRWLGLSGQEGSEGYLITNCSTELPLPPGIKNLHWKDL